jgi:hypothetical protein
MIFQFKIVENFNIGIGYVENISYNYDYKEDFVEVVVINKFIIKFYYNLINYEYKKQIFEYDCKKMTVNMEINKALFDTIHSDLCINK